MLYVQHLTCNALHDFCKQSILIVKIKSNQIKSKEDHLLKEVYLFLDGKVDFQNHFVASFFHYIISTSNLSGIQGFSLFLISYVGCTFRPDGFSQDTNTVFHLLSNFLATLADIESRILKAEKSSFVMNFFLTLF